jgi:hypothetical protein
MLASRALGRIVPVVVLVAALGRLAGAQVLFTDVALSAGVGIQTYKANTSHGLGAACIDINNDDWPDLFCVNGKGKSSHLYLNLANGTFQLRDDLLPPLPDVEKPGSYFADYDNDGDSDIYIITDNELNILSGVGNPEDGPPNLLLKNLWVELGSAFPAAGQPLFQEVAAAAGVDNLATPPFSSVSGTNYTGWRDETAAWLDYDRDGWIDLLLGHWSCGNIFTLSNWDQLYRNKGDGTFEEVTVAAGLPDQSEEAGKRPSIVALAGHIDQDLWPDIYFGNASCGLGTQPPSMGDDQFLRNTGLGTFHEAMGDSPGVGNDTGTAMGIAIGDIDNDGDWDLYITDIYDIGSDSPPPGNPLYVNNGNGTFQDNSAPSVGVDGETSWPANFFDADDDGDEDLFMGAYSGFTPMNRFWLNDGSGGFTDVSAACGVQNPANRAFGSALSDFDRDGDVDLFVINGGSDTMSLLRNNSINTNHWLGIKLVATTSNRSAIGTLLKAKVGSLQMMRQVLGGTSAHSQDSLFPHFGLGSATSMDSLDVFWPSGIVTHLSNVPADQYITVTEGSQYFAAFGAGCSGGETYAPSLIFSGSASLGGSFAIDIASAQGGGSVFLLLGLPQLPPLTVKSCPLHIQVPFSLFFLGATTGTLNGQGNYHLPAAIPPTSPLVSVALQAFVVSPSLPKGASSTNAVTMTILP